MCSSDLAEADPKIDDDEPKAGVLDAPKRDGEEPAPNAGLEAEPNMDGVVDDAPKGLEEAALNGELKAGVEVAPNPEEPKAGGFGAKGLEEVALEKGFADVWPNTLDVDAPKGFDCAGEPKLSPLAG